MILNITKSVCIMPVFCNMVLKKVDGDLNISKKILKFLLVPS